MHVRVDRVGCRHYKDSRALAAHLLPSAQERYGYENTGAQSLKRSNVKKSHHLIATAISKQRRILRQELKKESETFLANINAIKSIGR